MQDGVVPHAFKQALVTPLIKKKTLCRNEFKNYHPISNVSFLSKIQERVVDKPGDSLVFIFPLATMLTFTTAVGKLNVRVLWHHHMLLQVISQSYCQVFVKSYNFVFEQIDKEGSPREK